MLVVTEPLAWVSCHQYSLIERLLMLFVMLYKRVLQTLKLTFDKKQSWATSACVTSFNNHSYKMFEFCGLTEMYSH